MTTAINQQTVFQLKSRHNSEWDRSNYGSYVVK